MDPEGMGVGLFPPTMKDPVPPPGPISLPANATFVSDADEEIFLLYTRLAALKPPDSTDMGHFHGLGSENSKEDALLVRIELTPSWTAPLPPRKFEKVNRNADRKNRVGKRKGSGSRSEIATGGEDAFALGHEHKGKPEPLVLEYQLFQDKTALRSRSGDTGSVLWKASIEFLSLVLQRLYFPIPNSSGLFDATELSRAHILELGAGTGLLALALAPLVRKYTATDIPALLPLLHKNLLSPREPSTANAGTDAAVAAGAIAVAALDWTLPAQRQIDVRDDPPEVLLVVDCIYHPTLVCPLLETMTALAVPRHTVALVVAELRAEDVLREFLEGWIARGWSVWSVAEGLLGPRWGMWVAWRES